MDEDGRLEEGELSDDDEIKESNDGTWFGIRMTSEGKIKAKCSWRNALIINLIGRYIGYHYLWRRLQAI